jgi:hypothetical protein
MSGNVSSVVIHSFFKNHEPPQINEGFAEIINIEYVPYSEVKGNKIAI